MPTTPTPETLATWFEIAQKFATSILITCAALLFLPQYLPSKSLQLFASTYETWIWLLLWASASILVAKVGGHLYGYFDAWRKDWAFPKVGKEKLSHLTEDEKCLLLTFIAHSDQPQKFTEYDDYEDLRSAGIVYLVPDTWTFLERLEPDTPTWTAKYRIQPWTVDYLGRHKSLLYPASKQQASK